ncbi:hypothetical protein HK104_007265 [Borealophlyctis nickersoniae]|nr:hypothetical protein HK104_007265 [Borealophlyctis nickersoniae]
MSVRFPNVSVIQRTTDWTINGVPGRTKAYPSDLKVRKEPPQVLPYFSPRRILSKAEKDATDWYNRTEELKRIEAFSQNASTHLNLNGNNRPTSVRRVEVTNTLELAEPERTPNPSFDDEVTYQPPRPPPPPPPSTSDSWVQVNPVSHEVSTVSTQTLMDYVDAATSTNTVATSSVGTSAHPSMSSMGTSTEPMDAGSSSRRRSRRPTVDEIMENVTSPPPPPEIPIPTSILQNQVEQAIDADLPPTYSMVENDLLEQPPQMVVPDSQPLYEAQRVVEHHDNQAVPPGYLFDGRHMPPGYTFQTAHAAPHVARPRRRTAIAPAAESRRPMPRYTTILSHDADTRGLPSSTVIRTPPRVQRVTFTPQVPRMANVIEPSHISAAPEALDLEPDTRGNKRRRGRNGNSIAIGAPPPAAVANDVRRKYNRVLMHDANTAGASSSSMIISPPSVTRLTTMPPRVRFRNVLSPEEITYDRVRTAEDEINSRPAKRRRR